MKAITIVGSGRTAKVKPYNHRKTAWINFPPHFGLPPIRTVSVTVRPFSRPLRKGFVIDTEMTVHPKFNVPTITTQEIADIMEVFSEELQRSQRPKMIVFDSLGSLDNH